MLSDDFVTAQREFENQYEKITIENLDKTESTAYRRKIKSILKVQQEEKIKENRIESLEERFGDSRVQYRTWEELSQEIDKTTATKAIEELVEIKRKQEKRRVKRPQNWEALNIDFNTLSTKEIFEKLRCTCKNRPIMEVVTEESESIEVKSLMKSTDLQQGLEARANSLFGIEENASKHEWIRQELRKYFEDTRAENTRKMWRTFNEFKSEMEIKKDTQELEMFDDKEKKKILEMKEKIKTLEEEQERSLISLKLREESNKAVGFSLSDLEIGEKLKFPIINLTEKLKPLYQSESEDILQQFWAIKNFSKRFVTDIIMKAEAHALRIRQILSPSLEKLKDSIIIEDDTSKINFLKLLFPTSRLSVSKHSNLTEELDHWEKLDKLNLDSSAAIRNSGQYKHVFKFNDKQLFHNIQFDSTNWKVTEKEWVTTKPYFVNSCSMLVKFVGNSVVPEDSSQSSITSTYSLGQGDEGSERNLEEWELLIKDFTLLSGKSIIRKFISTWKRKETWGYSIDFIREKSDSTSDFYFYEVKWSLPTSSCPIPTKTVIVFFTIEVPRILPVNCPVIITYNFEGCSTSYALTDLERPEEFLKDTLKYKEKLFQRITY